MNPQQNPIQPPQQPYTPPSTDITESLGQTAVNSPVPLPSVPPTQPQVAPQQMPASPSPVPADYQAPQTPNTLPQVDASQFFQSSVPAQQAPASLPPAPPVITQEMFAPDALPLDGTYAPEPSHKKRILLASALIAVSLVLSGSAFMLLKPKGNSSNSQPDTANAEITEGIENGDLLSTASESPESDTITDTAKDDSKETDKSSAGSSSSSGGSSSSSTSSSSSKPSSSTGGTTTSPKPKPSPSKPTPTAPGLMCTAANATAKSQVTDPALSQAAKSILVARGGGTSQLLSWVPKAYRNEASGKTVPEIDASFKRYQPKNCKIDFAYSVPKTTFSGRAIVMIATFDQTTSTGKHFAHINVAYVKGAWRTYGMSEINKAP